MAYIVQMYNVSHSVPFGDILLIRKYYNGRFKSLGLLGCLSYIPYGTSTWHLL